MLFSSFFSKVHKPVDLSSCNKQEYWLNYKSKAKIKPHHTGTLFWGISLDWQHTMGMLEKRNCRIQVRTN